MRNISANLTKQVKRIGCCYALGIKMILIIFTQTSMKIATPNYLILLLFVISVVVRIPTINRPLSNHHEFVTAHVLRIMQIWKEDGLVKNHFNPIMNYPGIANKFINNQTLGDFDKNGNDFYQSYPPFAYLLPYLIFQVLHISITPLALEIINLLLHLAECFLLYHIVCLLLNRKEKTVFVPGIIAVTLHLFNPCALWFHSNVYMTDMPAVTFWLLSVFVFLKMQSSENLPSLRGIVALFSANFFLNYTEYLGVTFTAVTVVYCLFKIKTDKKYFFVAAVLMVSCLSAIAVTVYQYSLINGFNSFMDMAVHRYATRSGYSGHFKLSVLFSDIILMVRNYFIGFLPEILLMATLLIVFRKRIISISTENKVFIKMVVFLFLPVLLHHLIFLRASALDFFMLKSSPFIAATIAWLFYRIRNQLPEINRAIAVVLTVVAGIFIFYYINRPGEISQSGNRYDIYKTEGNFIAENSKPDEVIFIQNLLDEPQLVYYAHRNLRTIEKEQQAIDFLKTYQRNKGIIFTHNGIGKISVLKKIERTE